MSGRQGAEDEFAVDADQDRLDDVLGGDMLALREGAGGKAVAVSRPGVMTAGRIEK